MNSNQVESYRIFNDILAQYILVDNEIYNAEIITSFELVKITHESRRVWRYVSIGYKTSNHKYAIEKGTSVNWNRIALKYKLKILLSKKKRRCYHEVNSFKEKSYGILFSSRVFTTFF